MPGSLLPSMFRFGPFRTKMVCVIECSVKCARATYRLTKGLKKALWTRHQESRRIVHMAEAPGFWQFDGAGSAAGLAAGSHVLDLGLEIVIADRALHEFVAD